MEDVSIDFENLSRHEILEKLQLFGEKASTKNNTKNLKTKLENLAKIHHPIHNYLDEMSQKEVRKVYMVIFSESSQQNFDRIKASISKEFFKKFPKSPLTAFKTCVQTGKFVENENFRKDQQEPNVTKSPQEKKTNIIEENLNCTKSRKRNAHGEKIKIQETSGASRVEPIDVRKGVLVDLKDLSVSFKLK